MDILGIHPVSMGPLSEEAEQDFKGWAINQSLLRWNSGEREVVLLWARNKNEEHGVHGALYQLEGFGETDRPTATRALGKLLKENVGTLELVLHMESWYLAFEGMSREEALAKRNEMRVKYPNLGDCPDAKTAVVFQHETTAGDLSVEFYVEKGGVLVPNEYEASSASTALRFFPPAEKDLN